MTSHRGRVIVMKEQQPLQKGGAFYLQLEPFLLAVELFLLTVSLVSRTHPSREVIFFGQILAKKRQKLFLYMTSGSLENKHFGHHVM